LRENFDRFNFEIYKEKEMVSFRRVILALAVLALFTGLASAQVVQPGGSSTGGTLSCAVLNTGNPTQVRAEGYAELLGDIVISCTGGTITTPISGAVPLANITVALNNTIVTSKGLSNGYSEALLLIDEPGAGASVGPGGLNSQNVCVASAGIGAGPGGCTTVANNVILPGGGNYYGAVLSGATATPVNVFPGIVSGNQVIFNGIPVLAPVTAGFARVFRITNIRGNASQFAGQAGDFQGQIPILASVSISSGIQLTNPLQTVGYLFKGLAGANNGIVRNAANDGGGSSALNLAQCGTSGLTRGAILRFTEGFAAAFKTRVAATASYSGAMTSNSGPIQTNQVIQNSPAQILPGSESGFVLNVPDSGGGSRGTAGLADFGTRLKATFNNVPTGINLFVSTTNLNPNGGVNFTGPTNTFPALQNLGGGLTNTWAGLVLSETATSGSGGFLPLVSNTNNSSGTLLFGPLPVDANGTATAVWEILSANPNATENVEFSVYYAYTGNPATNVPPTNPAGTVAFSFAPTYTSPTASGLVPRFVPPSTTTPIVSAAICQTVLMYPWVNAEPGFDTGIAIANTSSDPFGTRTQNGTCTLNFFGTGAGTTTTATTPTINTGTVYADQVSNLKPGFRGYVIAVCNFTLAHGYGLFSDTGIRNWATGYLALVLSTGSGNRNSQNISYAPVTPGVEGGIH
jgi:hypothetical protein